MRNKFYKPMMLISVIFIPILFSCATTSELKQESKEQIIDMGSYSVSFPPSNFGMTKSYAKFFGKWEIEMEKEKGIVSFQLVRRNPLAGNVLDITLIQVFQNTLKPEGWLLSEEEVANDYRKSEEKTMNEEGVAKGQYKLENLKWDSMTLGGKKLYTMSYTTLTGTALSGFTQKATLFLYFPPNFSESHNFYMFLLSFLYPRGALRAFYPTEEIYYVINSFQEK